MYAYNSILSSSLLRTFTAWARVFLSSAQRQPPLFENAFMFNGIHAISFSIFGVLYLNLFETNDFMTVFKVLSMYGSLKNRIF